MYIFSLLPTVVATLLTSAYILNFWPWLELPLVNVLCAPLIMLTFVHGLTEEVNKYKAFAFTTSVVIAGIETFLNFSTDKITLEVFRLELLSPWSFGWAGMLLISIGAFLAVLIRLLLWSQDKWMEVKEMRQAQRMEQRQLHIENRRQRQSEAQKARQERLEQERQHSKEVLQRRQAAEKETREQEYARQKEAYQHKFEKQDERFKRWKEFVERQRTARANGTQPEDSSTWKITKNVFRWFLYIAIISILAFLFWKVPYYSLSNTVAEDSPWIDHVVVFVELLQHQESKDTEELTATSVFENQKDDESGDVENRVEQLSRPNPVQALIYYLVIFSVAIGVILMLLIIIWSLVGRIFKCKKSMIDFSFATDYDLPISILLVFLAILLVLGGNGLNLGQTPPGQVQPVRLIQRLGNAVEVLATSGQFELNGAAVMKHLQQNRIVRRLGRQVQGFVDLQERSVPRHIAAGMVHSPFHKHAVFGYSCSASNLLEVQHFKNIFRQMFNAGDAVVFREYSAELRIIQGVGEDMTAPGAVGQVDQPGQRNGVLFHLQQSGEDGVLCFVQLREPLCQGVQLAEAAVPVEEGLQLLELRIFGDLPEHGAVFPEAEPVQRVQHLVRRGGKVQRGVSAAVRRIPIFQIHIENRLHIDRPPI